MTPPIELAQRLLALAERDITAFRALASHSEVDISATGFEMSRLVDLVYRWAHGVVAA